MIHDFIYKSQGKNKPKRGYSQYQNYGWAGTSQEHYSFIMQSLKMTGGYQSPKSMANNKIQGELWFIKTELSTSKYHLHAKAFPHCQKITLKNSDIALTKAGSIVSRYILISVLFIFRKMDVNISNSMKLLVNLISSPRWTVIGVGVWSKLIKHIQVSNWAYVNISPCTSKGYFSGCTAIFYNLYYWF